MRRDLSDAFLRTLSPPTEGRLEVRDARVVGLVLRLMPNGKATWSVRTRTKDGKQTRPKLGAWPAMGIADARKAARAALTAVDGVAFPAVTDTVTRLMPPLGMP